MASSSTPTTSPRSPPSPIMTRRSLQRSKRQPLKQLVPKPEIGSEFTRVPPLVSVLAPRLEQRARVADERIECAAQGLGSADPSVLDRVAADPRLEAIPHSLRQRAPNALDEVRAVILRVDTSERRERVARRQGQRRKRRRHGRLDHRLQQTVELFDERPVA